MCWSGLITQFGFLWQKHNPNYSSFHVRNWINQNITLNKKSKHQVITNTETSIKTRNQKHKTLPPTLHIFQARFARWESLCSSSTATLPALATGGFGQWQSSSVTCFDSRSASKKLASRHRSVSMWIGLVKSATFVQYVCGVTRLLLLLQHSTSYFTTWAFALIQTFPARQGLSSVCVLLWIEQSLLRSQPDPTLSTINLCSDFYFIQFAFVGIVTPVTP